MATVTATISAADAQFAGLHLESLQASPLVIEVAGAMADDDDVKYTFAAAGDTFLPPRLIQVYRHTGGDITNTVNDTWAVSNGDTLLLQIDSDGDGTFVQYTHTLASVTGGAATAAQVAASINADSAINSMVFAVAALTAQRVTLFPKTFRGAVRVVGGTAQSVLLFPGTIADAKARTYVSQAVPVLTAGTGWSYSYAAATRVLTVKNETGGAVNRVCILVWR